MECMNRRLTITLAALALLLGGCTSSGTDSTAEPTDAAPAPAAEAQELLAERDLDGLTTPELIDHLDRLGGADRPNDLIASVRVDHLLLSDGEQEFELGLPDDDFYLSFAPYVNQSHDCFYHSLTTCQGELTDEPVDVTIVDKATGEVLVDEQATTFANGFVGYWLPRDIDATLQVSYGDLSAETDFSTGEDGATCLTTLQLT